MPSFQNRLLQSLFVKVQYKEGRITPPFGWTSPSHWSPINDQDSERDTEPAPPPPFIRARSLQKTRYSSSIL